MSVKELMQQQVNQKIVLQGPLTTKTELLDKAMIFQITQINKMIPKATNVKELEMLALQPVKLHL